MEMYREFDIMVKPEMLQKVDNVAIVSCSGSAKSFMENLH